MELVNGVTLEKRLSLAKLSKDETVSISLGIIAGIIHIHAQGMTHGDLHAQNVMIVGDSAKIIDILYLNSLASISTENRMSRVKRDLLSLRLLLQEIIAHADMDSAEVTELRNILNSTATFEEFRSAFQKITTGDFNREQRAVENRFPSIKSVEDDAGLGRDRITLRFQCAPTVLPIYNEFNVVLENPEALASLRSRISLGMPVSITVHLSDPTDYSILKLQNTPWQREDLIEAAIKGVEKRRAALERRITWCLDAIVANGMQSSFYLEQCIKCLCERMSESSGNKALVDVVNYKISTMYFKARLPDEAVQQISDDREWPRPITSLTGCDLFDLPTPIVFGYVLPFYAFSRDLGRELPDTFIISEWWWGEA